MTLKRALVIGDSPASLKQIDSWDELDAPGGIAVPLGKYVFFGNPFSLNSIYITSEFNLNELTGHFYVNKDGALPSYLSLISGSESSFVISGGVELKGTSSGDLTWGRDYVWHEGNDGSGSGLDADLLDGQEGSYYLNLSNTSGTLPIANGGTGQTTVALARNALGLGNTSGALPIENGGTGQTTAALARNALGLGNTMGALPIANGGTGATTAALARNNLGLGNTAGALPIANGGTAATTVALARNNLGLGNTAGALPVANGGTGAADSSTARTNLGLGTSATRNVPAFGNAAATEVVLGSDTRLSGGAVPGATTQVIYNNAGSLTGSANMTFDGTTFKSAQAQARLRSITQNATVTMSSATFPDQNLIVKKTATASYTYTIDSTLGSDDCTITFVNASTTGNMTIQGSGVTIYRNGTGVSTIVLTPRQMVTLVRIASGQWIC